ncbi:Serine/threonine-protein phosphatase 2A activator [Apophysomyces ossiformis]|uniref:Serine/threonine-protein phosphatase 2A activator n=1 Tax=Apophysomyces ossiformis TaxID=679940 RepID=A0A8H7EMT9_9FUNG|nr:Serine/threonine-protein phosphatase 2A activator [Apophysomyces ossiformis]
MAMLDELDAWLAEFPPLDNPQRFGNKAFRQWLERLEERADDLMHTALSQELHVAIPELRFYLVNGFGNGTRIDYGSGHELNFFAWLGGVAMLDGFTPQDYQAIVTRVFVRYLELVRKIQRTYTLEPAGSHGVWGLDDHQFLPYVWGSAQLLGK